jgi:hypothetical protein
MRLRFLISAVSSLLFLLTPSLRAADRQWPAKFGNWNAVPGSSARAWVGSNDPVMRESGLVSTSSKNYRDGGRELAMTLFTFRDSSGAYEGYTFLQGRSHDTVIVKSNQVLSVSGAAAAEDLVEADKWVESISDHVASPPIATYMPSHSGWRPPGRYALGPVGFQAVANDLGAAAGLAEQVGFNSGAEAMFGRYESGSGKNLSVATLLLIEYPTPQLAELHLKHMQRAILALKNGTSVERKGSLLSIVFAPTSQEYAEKLRSAVNYETQVTWSEPSTTATDPPIMSTLVKIFIATGVFMVVTVVVGIAFGGVRIITKRLFPGKVFDRKNQIEVLQLGLSSKPIDPTDMY